MWRFIGVVLAFFVAWLAPLSVRAQTPVQPPGGGTGGDPYRVSTLSHLAWLSSHCSPPYDTAVYAMQNDIDASETTNWHGGAGFTPIGVYPLAPFRGTFNGNGYAIRNLTIRRPAASKAGLFSMMQSGTITGLSMIDCAVTASNEVGGLVGYLSLGTVSGCRVSGTVAGSMYVGGLLGNVYNGVISGCSATGAVTGGTYVGGLIGYIYGDTVSGSYAAGSVSAGSYGGGLIGYNNGTVSGSYAAGSVSADYYVGGLIGVHSAGTVNMSYAVGSVSAGYYVGGLIGFLFSGTVNGCYSAGAVSWNYLACGGLIGTTNEGAVTASYWDMDTSGRAASAGGTGKTTAEMTDVATFEKWDFDSEWEIGGVSYPHLRALPAFNLLYMSGLHGSVTGWLEQVVNVSCKGLPCTAVPDTGYHFTAWSDGSTAAVRVDSNVVDDIKVQAEFALNVITVVTDRATVTVPEGGMTNIRVRLSAQPLKEEEVEVAWTDGDEDIAVSEKRILVFTSADWTVYQAVTLTAAEDDEDNANGSATITCEGRNAAQVKVTATEADDDFTLAVTSVYGRVSRTPDTPYYEPGTLVTLTTTPDPAYYFKGYAGDLAATNNPASLTMNGNRSVTVQYGPVAPAVLPPRSIASKSFAARWKWVEGGAPEGDLCVASNASFSLLVPGYEARYIVNGTDGPVTNLSAGRDYWYRVRRLMPDGSAGPWSAGMKARTGKGMPAFKNLLSEVPVSKGVSQEWALARLTTGTGTLAVKSSNAKAVKAVLSSDALTLQYLWKDTDTAARVMLTLTHPGTGYKVSYATTVIRATGSVAVVGNSALTNAGTRVAQELTLENRTGSTVFGIRVRAWGLDDPRWLINRSGQEPGSQAAIREIPCVLPAGSQMVVRLVYHIDYRKQARTRPVAYKAWAVMPPVNGAGPERREMTIRQRELYDGLWLLGLPADRNRLYSVSHSDDGGGTWTTNVPLLRATANSLMWLDTDDTAPPARQYRVEDAGL